MVLSKSGQSCHICKHGTRQTSIQTNNEVQESNLRVPASKLSNHFNPLSLLTGAKLLSYKHHDKEDNSDELKEDVEVVLQVLVASSFQVWVRKMGKKHNILISKCDQEQYHLY